MHIEACLRNYHSLILKSVFFPAKIEDSESRYLFFICCPRAGVGNPDLKPKSDFCLLVNKVLFKHKRSHFLTYCLWMLLHFNRAEYSAA